MKISVCKKSYDYVVSLPDAERKKPLKPAKFWRFLLKAVSASDLKAVGFECKSIGMEALGDNENALYLMNHSSFIDLKIASTILYPKPFNIVCTSDGFVGKAWLMRHIGCIPARKFVTDLPLYKDMLYAAKTLKNSILLYPEASYSFDGRATALPDTMGGLIKRLGLPVVMIRTFGAFHRDPLYNGLQNRSVRVTAEQRFLLSEEQVNSLTAEEINAVVNAQFDFDGFEWQKENKISVSEPFRADYLHRVLYKCPVCGSETGMCGKGTELKCTVCGKSYIMDEYGELHSGGEVQSIPALYDRQRESVMGEIAAGTYNVEFDCNIYILKNDILFDVGEGHLKHDCGGFELTGCDGKLQYRQSCKASYDVYSDFNWYEIGDVVCIGNGRMLYYCFPKNGENIAAKVRIAAEELYKSGKKNG